MPTVSVNPPRTPVTKGSKGVAPATLPNVCKMPGPPAPFVPTPLPNVGESGNQLRGATKTVKMDGQPVAVKGATFGSRGDIASKPTGGGLVSANTHGETKFVATGSINVKCEGKNVHLLGDAMTNNNGNPPNSATLPGVVQWTSLMVRGLDKGVADALCDAACKAIDDRGTSRTTQDAMAKRFAESKPPLYRPTNPNILPEVSQRIPPARHGGMTTLLSGTGATVGKGGPTAPMSMMKAMHLSPPRTMTRWDFVVPENPALPATNGNIKHYVEVKFRGDKLTKNQEIARSRMTLEEKDKIIELDPAGDCICIKKGGEVIGKARQRAART
ncbi:PAAR-like domain-containing protein [Paraliomyxa miuraensis]|uniref:PAAR-like domain-containing protein n=1 Tax=Paraliomyxa miuraensis TaxID=376150 RepID=UPI002256290F|nr:PAAR-like domain-containing protein [Paraliomyxa miuraensis]MCX4239735.1 DUF4150 domain-containing protein [Paraliomyxa miuraensis]